jgi:hypothetical protein
MVQLSGEWHSYYRYPSSGRGDDFWGQHLLRATQTDKLLKLESGPESHSHVIVELEIGDDFQNARGTWSESTDPEGYYKGALYEGTIEIKIADSGERMNGVWHGAGKDGEMHSDIWEFAKVKSNGRKSELPSRWKLTHWYPTFNDDDEDSDEHEMKSYWHDDTLVLESLPKDDGSYMLARLHIQDNVVTGNWYETASLTGKYNGAQYSGAGQLVFDTTTYLMDGLWCGAGLNRDHNTMQVYTGRWRIEPLEDV